MGVAVKLSPLNSEQCRQESQREFLVMNSFASEFWDIERSVAGELGKVDFADSKVKYILNPLEYCEVPHLQYLQKFLTGPKSVLFLGLNPGPWGCGQTGVPFGEVTHCQTFLNISGEVRSPACCPPKVKILGFNSTRREVSGERFWRFVQSKWSTADNFFQNCFVHNYCPLIFTTETGKNITPAELKSDLKKVVMSHCDSALLETLALLQTTHVVAVGRFVYDRVNKAVKQHHLQISLSFLLHPSPANPAANKGWDRAAELSLSKLNIF